jgi:MFS family permease
MVTVMLPLRALLTGVALLLAGSGLLGTLLAVLGGQAGFSDSTLGWIMSGYFAGFFLGTFAAPPLIRRIGHIRTFAFYSGLCTIAVLLHPIWLHPLAWGVLRFVTGLALVGLYTVIESWLTALPDRENRSRVFAAYMAINLGALAAGQALLGLGGGLLSGPTLFTLVAILLCAAALPVTLTRLQQPHFPPTPRLGLRRLGRTAPAAAAAAGLSGLAMGAFWGLAPVYGAGQGWDPPRIAQLMIATIVGGALLQWPLGRWSDRRDRRIGLALACAAAVALASAMAFAASRGLFRPQLALFFLYGGVAFAIYPMAVAHLLDNLPQDDLLAGCSSLLLVHGLGAAVGPVLAGYLMQGFGPVALPLYFAAVLSVLGGYAWLRLRRHERDRAHPTAFHPMLRTTPAALELLPETGEGAPADR